MRLRVVFACDVIQSLRVVVFVGVSTCLLVLFRPYARLQLIFHDFIVADHW